MLSHKNNKGSEGSYRNGSSYEQRASGGDNLSGWNYVTREFVDCNRAQSQHCGTCECYRQADVKIVYI